MRYIIDSQGWSLVEKTCRFPEGDKDVPCSDKSAQSLLEAYISQLLKKSSDLTTDEELMAAACVYLEEVNGRRLTGALYSFELHLDCNLSRSLKSTWCLSSSILTRTGCITTFNTYRKRSGLMCEE